MPLDLPLLRHHITWARTLAGSYVRGEMIEFTPQSIWDHHFQRALQFLHTKEGKSLIKQFSLPLASPYVESLVRKSLGMQQGQRLENHHVQVAVASALLCPLRQVIGSCFATAPAIFIQREQPERLLQDLYDLMMIGQMKRTFGGEEFTCPMSPKSGERESDHPLLRVWEYTLASFSDYKTNFSRWNMFQSLGFDPKQPGGIGELLQKAVQEKLDVANAEAEKMHEEYVRAVDEMRVSQALMRQADNPDRMRMRKGELDLRASRAYGWKESFDQVQERAQSLARFFSFLVEQYIHHFPEYFIEIYDPDIEEVHQTLYEDSPAGFRLCYKHGRTDPTTWTVIHHQEEFFTALRQFFLAVEPSIHNSCEWEEGKTVLEELTTKVIHFLDTKAFQSFALKDKRPWSYTSGGSMQTLLKGYYCIEGELAEEKRVIESPTDLLTFYLDLMKSLPYPVTRVFEIDPYASLLAYSPTHAFLLKPGLSPFKEGWLDKGFTYTWIRDHLILPAQTYYQGIQLAPHEQALLGDKVLKEFHPCRETLSITDFRAYLYECAPRKEDEIDQLLFQSFHPPKPLLVADTNWADYFFAFAVNPATLELDLYRVSTDGGRIYPMNPWRPYLDGSSTAPWGVLTRPSDLSGSPVSDILLKINKI